MLTRSILKMVGVIGLEIIKQGADESYKLRLHWGMLVVVSMVQVCKSYFCPPISFSLCFAILATRRGFWMECSTELRCLSACTKLTN